MPFIPDPNNPSGPQIEVTQAEYNEWVNNLTSQDKPVSNPPDPQVGAGETVAAPPADAQQDGNTSGYGEQNETQVSASEVRLSKD